ncbi:MAG: hypothetical protein JJT94_08185 [Bernardetiaceae bacterium]|nr:hypothetical protein [Bernardetiaceae bacterium]
MFKTYFYTLLTLFIFFGANLQAQEEQSYADAIKASQDEDGNPVFDVDLMKVQPQNSARIYVHFYLETRPEVHLARSKGRAYSLVSLKTEDAVTQRQVDRWLQEAQKTVETILGSESDEQQLHIIFKTKVAELIQASR